jgi:hypothetical protein
MARTASAHAGSETPVAEGRGLVPLIAGVAADGRGLVPLMSAVATEGRGLVPLMAYAEGVTIVRKAKDAAARLKADFFNEILPGAVALEAA